ncbi:hypothetical protein JMUB6875_32340 [Nocardia sp. JMUB6875]
MATPQRKSGPSEGTVVGAPELPVPEPLALPEPLPEPEPLELPEPPAISAGPAPATADPPATIAAADSSEHRIRVRLISADSQLVRVRSIAPNWAAVQTLLVTRPTRGEIP